MVQLIHRYQVGANSLTDNTFAILPSNYKFDGTKTGILFQWGFGDNRDTMLDPSKAGPFIYGLAEAGFPVVVSELGNPTGSTSQWGNANARTRLNDAKAFLQGSTINAKPGKVAVSGFSMGAMTVMAWAKDNKASVHSIGGFCPVSDLNDIHGKASYTASIDTAYGGTWTQATNGADSNPTTFASGLSGIPTKFWYSFNDTAVPQATVLGLATAIGSSASTKHAGGLGHSWDVPKVSLNEYVAFLKANGA